jgi:hypothetical protein
MNEQLNIRINVIYKEAGKFYPIYATKKSAKQTINLLLHKIRQGDQIVHHFSYIEDLSKLLRKTYPGKRKSYQKSFICGNCFSKFSNEKFLSRHEKDCFKGKCQKVSLSHEDIIFKDHFKRFKLPFVGFFDFESTNQKIKEEKQCTVCDEIKCEHKTKIEALQKACAYSYIVLGPDGVIDQHTYHGIDPVNHMLKQLLSLVRNFIRPELQKYPNPILTPEEESDFEKTESCHICTEKLSVKKSKNNLKVRDHCHLTGKYLGAAHDSCNLQRRTRGFLTMYAHNFSGYDSHLILKDIKPQELLDFNKRKQLVPVKITGIPFNSEKMRSLDIGPLKMVDSLGFLQGSLSQLTENLVKSGKMLNYLKQSRLYHNEDEKKLLLRKQVYPYDFATSLTKLRETKVFPKKHLFFNKLTDSNISDEDYFHGKKVFKTFNCENMLDYTLLYVRLDVILLCEVFMEFREIMHKKLGLDPCRFKTLPSFAYQCMLKKTGVCIEAVHDIDVHNFLAHNIRGGFSFISKRECESNDDTSICYLDANNL